MTLFLQNMLIGYMSKNEDLLQTKEEERRKKEVQWAKPALNDFFNLKYT